MNKRKTIRFFTDTGLYMGWRFADKANRLELSSWLSSGNILKCENRVVSEKGGKSFE